MRNRIRHLPMIVAAAVLFCILSGCGNPKTDSGPSAVTVCPTETAVPTVTPTPTVSPTPTATPVPDPVSSPTPTPDYTSVRARYTETEAEREKKQESLSKVKTLPILSITTEDGRTISEKSYETTVVDLYNCDEQYAFSGKNAEVRVRGNSTANDPPYPYRIRFSEKQNLLGLHEGNEYHSWVLLKPTWNLCPDYIAHRVAKVLFEDRYYASDGCFVNVVMNGQVLGVYYLCEQNQAAKGRIDVNEPKDGDTSVLTGYVLELDNYASDEHPHFSLDFDNITLTDWQGETRKANSHSYSLITDTYSEDQRAFIENYFRGVWEIVYRGCELNEAWGFDAEWNLVKLPDQTAFQAVTAVVDVYSFYNMIILQELCQDYDVGAGSMYYCVDFSADSKYPRLTVQSPWDYNWGYQEDPDSGFYATTWQTVWTDHWDRSNIWFIVMMKAEWFRNGVFARWKTVSADSALSETLDAASEYIETARNDEGANSWRVDCGQDVINFVRKRMTFLDRNFCD